MRDMGKWMALGLISAVSTLIVWLPFLLSLDSIWGIKLPTGGMKVVESNFDGPLYIVVAKTFYDFSSGNKFEFPLPNQYYAAHYPLYPILVRIMSPINGFPFATLSVTLLASIAAVLIFYNLCKSFMEEGVAFWIALISLFLPARYLVVRSIGSPEPLFLLLVISSLWAFSKQKYWLAGISGAMATLTKSPGILLFLAFGLYWIWIKKGEIKWWNKAAPLLLIPLVLIGLFGVFKTKYGDFWVYFHSGDNIHLQNLPFKIFNSRQPWVGDHWLEDVIWIYLIGLIGLISLIRQKRYEMASFVAVFLVSIFFVSHRDVSRYALPMMPFALLSLGSRVKKENIRVVFWVILLPVFLYSINFLVNNVMPISNWGNLY